MTHATNFPVYPLIVRALQCTPKLCLCLSLSPSPPPSRSLLPLCALLICRAIEVLEGALRIYKPDEIAMSFNGGKV